MCVKNVSNRLKCEELNRKVPIFFKRGHINLEWSKYDKILRKKIDIVKPHRKFSRPLSNKLLKVLKLDRTWIRDEMTRDVQEDIVKWCEISRDVQKDVVKRFDPYQKNLPGSVMFRLSIPDETELEIGA